MKILICSDGSESADRAIRLGAAIAIACEAQVTLLGITEPKGNAESILEALKKGQRLLEEKKIPAELITKAGEPIEEIVNRTREARYDLVVIGAASREARGHFWRSSKTYKIIKNIEPPVLAVMGDCATIKRILICTGGTTYSNETVTVTGPIARGMGATATLFHVMPELPAIYAELYRAEMDVTTVLNSRSALGKNLLAEKNGLEALGVATEVRLRQGVVMDEILNEIRSGDYDLVVSGSSLNRGSLHTQVLGDVTREIVNRVNRAVLVVRVGGRPATLTGKLRVWLGIGGKPVSPVAPKQ